MGIATPPSELARAIGARILACRLATGRGWSQEACWTACGISRRQWQRLEGGKCLPHPVTWEAIKRLFPELSTPPARPAPAAAPGSAPQERPSNAEI